MEAALSVAVVFLLNVVWVAVSRIIRLKKDLEWWRNESIRLNNEVGKWRSVASECQQKANKLIQERAESIAGYMAQLKRSICEMDSKCPLNNKEE